MTKTKIEIVLQSDHGDRPVEDFKKHLQDLKSEGLERFGLEIRFQEVEQYDEQASTDDFKTQ